MTRAVDEEGAGGHAQEMASPLDRLSYIGALTVEMRQMAAEAGFERLSVILGLAVSEVESLKEAYWTGQSESSRAGPKAHNSRS